jgi:hypothetical protein
MRDENTKLNNYRQRLVYLEQTSEKLEEELRQTLNKYRKEEIENDLRDMALEIDITNKRIIYLTKGL